MMLNISENEVDGESFMDLSESDLKEMIPNKMGVVKKILKLQQEVSFSKSKDCMAMLLVWCS